MFEPVNDLIFITSTHPHRHVYVDGTSLVLVIICRLLKGSRYEWWLEVLLIRADKDIGTIKYDSKNIAEKNTNIEGKSAPALLQSTFDDEEKKSRILHCYLWICNPNQSQGIFESKLVLWGTRGTEEAIDDMSNRVPRWFWHCGSGESDNQ